MRQILCDIIKRTVFGYRRDATRTLIDKYRVPYQENIRPHIPAREPVRLAGIAICHDIKWGDSFVPRSWIPSFESHSPGYEFTLVQGLREIIKTGDRIVIVGGGLGVTATVAALCVGPSGSVECFEASE